jgi:hypothetical protein
MEKPGIRFYPMTNMFTMLLLMKKITGFMPVDLMVLLIIQTMGVTVKIASSQ